MNDSCFRNGKQQIQPLNPRKSGENAGIGDDHCSLPKKPCDIPIHRFRGFGFYNDGNTALVQNILKFPAVDAGNLGGAAKRNLIGFEQFDGKLQSQIRR